MDRDGRYRYFRRHAIVTFYLLAFAISWLGFVPLLNPSVFRGPLWDVCLVLPGCGPAVAVGVTLRLMGVTGNPWHRLVAGLHWRVSPAWYAVALFGPLALHLLANGLGHMFPRHSPALVPASAAELLTFTVMSLAANPWEEVGWRCFALTRLQLRFNTLTAALIVGVLWGVWHIPLFLWHGSAMSTFPFWPWFAGILGRSCLYAWLFNRTGRSLAIAIVFHFAFNLWGALLGTDSLFAVAIVDMAAAAALVWRDPSMLRGCNTHGSAILA